MTNALKNLAARAWLPIIAFVPLLNLFIARLLTATDGQRVRVAGYELHGACWWQERFGAPCPFCGITRSIVLTVHGELARAVQLNPAGVMIILGVVLVCAACVFLGFSQNSGAHLDAGARSATNRMHNRIALLVSLYTVLTVVVIVVGWAWRLRLIWNS